MDAIGVKDLSENNDIRVLEMFRNKEEFGLRLPTKKKLAIFLFNNVLSFNYIF